MAIYTYLSIIILNGNGQNAPIKIDKTVDRIKKKTQSLQYIAY